MKNKLISIIISLIILLSLSLPGNCTELPENIVSFVKEKFPEVKIRFDGMIELPDSTKYLPVLPIVRDKSEKPLEVVQTIPKNADFLEKPDMILFNNNFALLKIIKREGGPPTVISGEQVPLKVKLGLFPQDLVVPKGLVLPQELKVILGDLKIPLKQRIDKEGEVSFYGRTEINEKNEDEIIGETAENITKLAELEFLKGKNLYTLNYKHNVINVINSQTGRVETEIKLPSIAFDMALASDERYLLLTGVASSEIYVVDTLNNEFVKAIPVGKCPFSIIAPGDKAYVANKLSSSISVIELTNMQVEKEIPVIGRPECLQIAENDKFLFYSDARSGKVNQLNLESGYSWELFQDKNISDIKQFGRYLFTLSRSEDTLTVFDLKDQEIIVRTETGNKPLDMKMLKSIGKIMVLCAGSDEINLLDMENFDMVKKIPLDSGGFPGKIRLEDNASKALITNYDAYEIIIYNIDAEKIQAHLPVNRIVNSVVAGKN